MVNTNYDVNERYVHAVDAYVFAALEEGTPSSLLDRDLNLLTEEIARKIIAASDVRPNFEALSGKTLSLRDTVYVCVQERDVKLGQDTPEMIEGEGADERSKEVLGHVFKKLSVDFVQVKPDDLKAVALLFGIHRICDLAMGRITQMPEPQSIILQKETALNQLVNMRNQYSMLAVNSATGAFLAQVDAQIAKTTRELAEHALDS